MTDKTDREIMHQAMVALDSKHDMTKAEWRYLQYHAFNDLRERLAQPDTHIAVRDSNGYLNFEALYLRAKQKAEKEAALSCPEGAKRKRLQEELTDRYFYEYTGG